MRRAVNQHDKGVQQDGRCGCTRKLPEHKGSAFLQNRVLATNAYTLHLTRMTRMDLVEQRPFATIKWSSMPTHEYARPRPCRVVIRLGRSFEVLYILTFDLFSCMLNGRRLRY